MMAVASGSGTSGSEPDVVRATCVLYVGMGALSARTRRYCLALALFVSVDELPEQLFSAHKVGASGR